MDLQEIIYKRKSTRSFDVREVGREYLRKIEEFSQKLKPLNPNIKVESKIVGFDKIKCFLPWRAPHYVVIFSEEKENFLTNVGFMYQQLDLYIQSLGLGTCWVGMGKCDSNVVECDSDKKFVIMIAFGKSDGELYRKDISEFKRKSLLEISDTNDDRLEVARLAPSAVNSQPWYFVHNENNIIHAYCSNPGLLKGIALSQFNKIDMGIGLAQIYIANINSFEYLGEVEHKNVNGYYYVGSFKI